MDHRNSEKPSLLRRSDEAPKRRLPMGRRSSGTEHRGNKNAPKYVRQQTRSAHRSQPTRRVLGQDQLYIYMSEVRRGESSARIQQADPAASFEHAPQDRCLLQRLQRVLADHRERTIRNLGARLVDRKRGAEHPQSIAGVGLACAIDIRPGVHASRCAAVGRSRWQARAVIRPGASERLRWWGVHRCRRLGGARSCRSGRAGNERQ